MDFKEYQEKSRETAIYPDKATILFIRFSGLLVSLAKLPRK